MGTKNSKNKNPEEKSTSSLYEKSLSSGSNKKKTLIKINSREDIINELKEEVNLPIENEYTDSPELIFEKKEKSEIKKNFENNDDDYCLNNFYPDDYFDIQERSKTFAPKQVILETPRLHSKASDNLFISPFKLSFKSYGVAPKWNQKPNKVLLDFQRDKIDCKSCNDKEEDILEELILCNADTLPNLEDLQDLLNCRKKMIEFRNSIDYSPCYEYENILNSEDIIGDIQKDNDDDHHHKKKSYLYKHIKNQLKQEKNNRKNSFRSNRLYSEPFPDIQLNCDNMDSLDDNKAKEDDDKDNGLFILGVIERAAKEKKRTKSVVIK